MLVCAVNSEVEMSLGADQPAEAGSSKCRRWVAPVAASILMIALTTVALWRIEAQLAHEHLIFIYFLPTALIAIRYGSISAVGVTITCSFIAAFLLYPPRYSLFIHSPLHFLELILFSLLALLATQVVSGFPEGARSRPRRRWSAWWSRARLLR